MRQFKTTAILLISTALATGAFAKPLVLSDISSEAKWVVHADVGVLRTTQVGQHILDTLDSEKSADKFAALQAVVNFDPRTDLDSVTLLGFGEGKRDGAMILRGNIDGNRLVTLVKANDTYEETAYAGQTLHSWIDEKKARHAERLGSEPVRSYGCVFKDDALLISDNRDALTHVIDVLEGNRSSMAEDLSLPALRQVQDASFFIAAANTSQMQNIDPKAAMFRNANKAALIITETGGTFNATLDMEASSEDGALNLSKVIDGMLGLAIMNAEGNPSVATLAKDATVTLNGTRLQVSVITPAENIIKCINQKCARSSNTPSF